MVYLFSLLFLTYFTRLLSCYCVVQFLYWYYPVGIWHPWIFCTSWYSGRCLAMVVCALNFGLAPVGETTRLNVLINYYIYMFYCIWLHKYVWPPYNCSIFICCLYSSKEPMMPIYALMKQLVFCETCWLTGTNEIWTQYWMVILVYIYLYLFCILFFFITIK